MTTDPLLPYQLIGAKWLTEKPWRLLADEMGVGKSAQCVRACDDVNAKRILVICPAIARYNWQNEFNLWSKTPREFQIILKERDIPLPGASVICSYDYASKFPERLIGQNWDAVISDEAHFLKGLDTKRTKGILGKGGIIHSTKRFWAVTGTPTPNHYGEIWVWLFVFGITTLKYMDFLKRFCHVRETAYGIQVTGGRRDTLPELKTLLDQVMLRRKKEDVLTDLPPLTFGQMLVEPGPVDLSLAACFAEYYHPEDDSARLFAKIEEQQDTLVRAMSAARTEATVYHTHHELTIAMAMAQSVPALRRLIGLQKVEPVAQLIEQEMEDKAYQKVVVFAIHRDAINNLRLRLKKLNPLTLYGGTSADKQQRNIKRFQEDPKYKVMIANIHAAGTGINLTAAHNVIFLEQDWVPGNNAQASMRCHRKGQTKPVLVRFVSLANSFDQRIGEMLKRKTRDLCSLYDLEDQGTEPETLPDPFS